MANNVQIAHRTLALFESEVKRDQGAAYRRNLRAVLPHIEDAYRDSEDPFRSHLGASQIGRECAREIWYGFRWAWRQRFSGQMIRLFNRGHLEEGRLIALLLTIGCPVYQQDENKRQYRISHSQGHFGGSGDGLAANIPDLSAGSMALTEFKTHSEDSFVDLAGPRDEWREHLADPSRSQFTGKGVRGAKFEHYVQTNIYMRKMGLAAGLYLAVNKNTDSIYGEIVPLNSELADQYLDRADKIIWMRDPPKKLSDSPGFYKCRYCGMREVCHLKAKPEQNCRTCAHGEPSQFSSDWRCGLLELTLEKSDQLKGCPRYELRKGMT